MTQNTAKFDIYQKRELKIQGRIRESRSFVKKQVIVPELLLCGRWFAECGFLPGAIAEVSMTEAGLLIRTKSGRGK